MSNSTEWQKKVEGSLQPVVNLAHTLLDVPLAIWLRKEPRSRELVICGSINLPEEYLNFTFSLGDDGTINEVSKTPFVKVPIQSQTEMLGVIGLFSTSEQLNNSDKLSQLIAVIATTVENLRDSYNAEKLAEVIREFNKAPSIEKALHLIVKYARELTRADSSIIFLFDQYSEQFKIGARSPDLKWGPRLPRQNGLTRHIIRTGNIYWCNDTNKDTEECKLAEKARGREHAHSLIGIPLQLKIEKLGVLYIRGQGPNQFDQQDIDILRVLADRASMILGWARFLLKPNTDVEHSISGLSNLEPLLDEICKEAREKLGFDYVALQLVDPEERTIATVAGEYSDYIPKGWTGVAKHSLDAKPELQDIQADIASFSRPRIEIITGWDERFDKWIYDEFKHDDYTRVYVPIVLIRDIHDEIDEIWFENVKSPTPSTKEVKEGKKLVGYRTTMEIVLPFVLENNSEFDILGTLEAGYYIPCETFQSLKNQISCEQAFELFRFIAKKALDIHKASLSYVLQTVAKGAKQILQADSADLCFLFNEQRNEYVYQVCTGEMCQKILKSHLPRHEDHNSLGQQAIREKRPKFIPDPDQGHNGLALEKFNPKACKDGIRTIAAFPLFVGDKHGVLYVHFRNTHWFNDDEIGWVENFAKDATTAIRYAISDKQKRDSVNTLNTLHQVVASLVNNPQKDTLLRDIAGNTVNILGADVVVIHEYNQSRDIFPSRDVVGQLLEERKRSDSNDPYYAPRLLISNFKNEKGIYIHFVKEALADKKIMNHPNRRNENKPAFIVREKIQSCLGILLRVNEEIVGTMFIHYRQPLPYEILPERQKRIIEILASAAAIAIKNRRREVISEDFRKIIMTTSLDELLKLIVKQAVEITNANVGEIRLLEGPPNDQKLVSKALHPEEKHLVEWNSSKLTEGIMGWVAYNKKARLVLDVSKEPVYIKFFSDLEVKSELCVPLLDQNENVLGTLLVDSVVLGKFTERDKRVLQVLADQAVIGIQNARRQKQLADTTTVTLLGALASQILHRVNNDVGAIQQFSKLFSSYKEEDKIRKIGRISELAKNVLTEINQLRIFSASNETQPVNLGEVIFESLIKVEIPNAVKKNVPEIPSDVVILCSKIHLTGVFVNLIQNAIDAMPKGGELSIITTKSESEKSRWIIVAVNDTGEGIPNEYLPDKIFSFGFTTKQKENDKKGLGMGLWWTKMYVERLGGRIDVENRIGRGTRFIVTLPIFV